MKKQLIILSLSLFSCSVFFSSFVGVANYSETPGLLQVIGDAGSPNIFTFKKWAFTRAEMPEGKIENLQLEIEINTGSLSTDWKELESNVKKKKDYFYIKKFPKATVKIEGVKALEDGQFTTEAVLTLKGITKPISLTFTLDGNKVKGEGSLNRRDFKFTGNGPKDEVPIIFDVELPF